MRSIWSFSSAGRVMFGRGAVEQLGRLCRSHAWGRVFIVTDPALEEAGLVERVMGALAGEGLNFFVFKGGQPEPPVEVAVRAAEQARDYGPDAILGLGGGSNMDLAKITAVLVAHGGVPGDYFGFGNVPGPIVPLVCVPTTAGTGSEVSHAAVLTDEANEVKVSTLSPWLRPVAAVVDPELTLGCPIRVTADSGMDALTHAIEATMARRFEDLPLGNSEESPYDGKNPLADMMAERAIELIGENLLRVIERPEDVVAREAMSLAAVLGGMAFSNGAVAVVHALEYPLGAVLHCSHGAGNGLLLPHVMRYNLPARVETLKRIGQLLGVPAEGGDERAAAEAAIDAVAELGRRAGIPESLRQLGAVEGQLPGFAAKAHGIGRLMTSNPRQPSEEDLLGILKAAY